MKLTKFGKALWIGALSVGLVLGVTSCVQSYTVGYLYVTGTVTASTGNNGIISGYKIDHNTGQLTPINGLPVASGGANPVRAYLTLGSRFLYVLNRGVNGSGNGNCYGTGANVCQNASIMEFAVGGNGILTPQQAFFSQGFNPFRMFVDTSGSYLFVLDHDAPDNLNPSINDNCALALGSGVTTCGDITVFKIDQTTGRLSTVLNQQVTAANDQPLTYFPVPANPVDFVLSGNSVLTLTGAPPPTSYPYVGGTEVWPYGYAGSTGQLTLSQNSVQTLGITQGTAIVNASSVIYVLDNEPITITSTSPQAQLFKPGVYPSQILPFTVGTGGALNAEPGGAVPDWGTVYNPIYVLATPKFVYLANQGSDVTGTNNPVSEIVVYELNSPFQLQFTQDQPFGSGAGAQCIVEDPTNQFFYEANEIDSTVTGQALDPNSGDLDHLRVLDTYKLEGPPTWCLVNPRTS